jgi:hypothetical protein
MRAASFQFLFISGTSISVPARKVRYAPPNVARKSIQAVVCKWNTLPATTPKAISIIAAARPNSIETMLARKTNDNNIVANKYVDIKNPYLYLDIGRGY